MEGVGDSRSSISIVAARPAYFFWSSWKWRQAETSSGRCWISWDISRETINLGNVLGHSGQLASMVKFQQILTAVLQGFRLTPIIVNTDCKWKKPIKQYHCNKSIPFNKSVPLGGAVLLVLAKSCFFSIFLGLFCFSYCKCKSCIYTLDGDATQGNAHTIDLLKSSYLNNFKPYYIVHNFLLLSLTYMYGNGFLTDLCKFL